jgi:hypothetical protein
LHTLTDSTVRVRSSRRLKTLRDLAAVNAEKPVLHVADRAGKGFADAPLDIPFALIYLLDPRRMRANLAAATGLSPGCAAAPHSIDLLAQTAAWPIAQVVRTAAALPEHEISARLAGTHCGPWPESPNSAILLPLSKGVDGPVAGVLVLGRSPRLQLVDTACS